MCILYEVGILASKYFIKVSKAPEADAASADADKAKTDKA
jgi:hypothetical protein